MWIVATIAFIFTQLPISSSPPNLIEGVITRLEKREGVELVYEVRLEKAVVGKKEHEGKIVGPISVYLGQGSRRSTPEPPPGAKVGDRHIWRVDVDAQDRVLIRDPLSSNTNVREALAQLSAGLAATQKKD
jgi:hypothetical protein